MTPETGQAFSDDAKALAKKSRDEIIETWQYKLLFETKGNNKEGEIVLCVLANMYLEALRRLMWETALLPVFPILTGHAKVMPGGQIVCDMMKNEHVRLRNVMLYASEDEMIGKFRRLADKLKLPDDQRQDMFRALKKWVSQDRRISPEGNRAA